MTSSIISGETCANEGILPADPFTSLQLHFGMLLGVDDLETLAANPRGKTRLHQAWLHREGVVWGLGLEMVRERGELKVKPGLAVDACGRELHVDVDQCVNLGRWFARHEADPNLTRTTADGITTFSAHVVLRFRACLTRAVPAMSDSCDRQELDTAYSRAYELAEVLLVPNTWEVKPLPYPRLRIFFGLAEPRPNEDASGPRQEDVDIVTRRQQIRSAAPETQAALVLAAFREYAAADAIEMTPASLPAPKRTLFPEGDDTLLFLGDVVDINVEQVAGEWRFAGAELARPVLNMNARPTHVASATVQELICGTGIELAADAGGPQILPETVAVTATTATLTASAPLLAASVKARGFALTTLDATNGWTNVPINDATVAGAVITLTLGGPPPQSGRLYRLIARGTGEAPLLADAAPNAPLAGAAGGPGGGAVEGRDFVHMAVFP